MRWNVVQHGRVVGEIVATSYADAQRAAVLAHGLGARASAPADAYASTSVAQRGPAVVVAPVRPIR